MRTTAERSADDRHDLIRAIDRLATEVHDAAAEVHDAIDRLVPEDVVPQTTLFSDHVPRT